MFDTCCLLSCWPRRYSLQFGKQSSVTSVEKIHSIGTINNVERYTRPYQKFLTLIVTVTVCEIFSVKE